MSVAWIVTPPWAERLPIGPLCGPIKSYSGTVVRSCCDCQHSSEDSAALRRRGVRPAPTRKPAAMGPSAGWDRSRRRTTRSPGRSTAACVTIAASSASRHAVAASSCYSRQLRTLPGDGQCAALGPRDPSAWASCRWSQSPHRSGLRRRKPGPCVPVSHRSGRWLTWARFVTAA